MKRINIILSDELAGRLERLCRRKELSAAEITRRSLEIYMQRFPELPHDPSPLPVFDFGEIKTTDFSKTIYNARMKEII